MHNPYRVTLRNLGSRSEAMRHSSEESIVGSRPQPHPEDGSVFRLNRPSSKDPDQIRPRQLFSPSTNPGATAREHRNFLSPLPSHARKVTKPPTPYRSRTASAAPGSTRYSAADAWSSSIPRPGRESIEPYCAVAVPRTSA